MKRVILPLLVLFGISMLFALESDPSDVVGYIQYTLSANDYDFVSVPFETDLVTASDFGTEIGAGVESISYWDGGAWQQWVSPLPFGNFNVNEGQSYFVACNSSTDVTYYASGVVGSPAAFDIVANDYTVVMVPLDCSDLPTASDLGTDMGLTANVATISAWNNGAFQQFVCGLPFGNFSISLGQGLFVYNDVEIAGWNGTVTRNNVRVQAPTVESSSKKIKE